MRDYDAEWRWLVFVFQSTGQLELMIAFGERMAALSHMVK